jgi:hypothetical protein
VILGPDPKEDMRARARMIDFLIRQRIDDGKRFNGASEDKLGKRDLDGRV